MSGLPQGHPDTLVVLTEVRLVLCSRCMNGDGGICATAGCALWNTQRPDLPLWHDVVPAIVDLEET